MRLFDSYLAAMTSNGWEPGPGDPSIAGWIIFGGYLLVAAYAWHIARLERARGLDSLPWRWLSVVCVALAMNKQLDLHNLITCVGRNLARSEGWYEQRRTFQLALIVVVVGLGLGAGWWTLRRLGTSWRRHRVTLAGMVMLLTFISIRAASFHHVDWFLREEWGTIRLHAVIEFTGICLLFVGARNAARTPPATPPNRPRVPVDRLKRVN